MKILFYGNCQTQVAMYALIARNPGITCEYAGNSQRVTKYDPDRTNGLMDWCDHIVTQPIMNLENADHHEVLRERFKGCITFMPYLWVDGLYSLCGAPGAKLAQGDVLDVLRPDHRRTKGRGGPEGGGAFQDATAAEGRYGHG